MNAKNQVSAWRYLCTVAGKSKWNIAILTVLQTVLGVSSVFYALLLREIINRAIAGKTQELYFCFILFALLVFIQIGVRTLIRYAEEYCRATMENRLKKKLYSALMSKDYAYVSAVHSGEWMNRLTSDTILVANGITEILPGLMGTVVRLVSAIVMLLLLEPKFGYVIIPGGILLILLSYVFRKKMKQMHKNVREKDGVIRSFMQESLGSLLVVHSYGMEETIVDSAMGRMKRHKKARMQRSNFSNFCNTGLSVVMNGVTVLGTCFCAYGILVGTYDYGTFMAVLQLLGQTQMPLANISGFLPRYYSMIASAERLIEVEFLEDRTTKNIKPLEEIQKFYAGSFEGLGLEKASFTYLPISDDVLSEKMKDETTPVVLDEFSIEIKKGEFIAFTGSSGCGKSTVLEVLMCLYELDGGIRFLLCDGEKKELTADYQKLFAYVPQGNHLMSGSIRDVITFADKKAKMDEDRIRKAVTIACADFVYELEDGLETQLGERGMGLSEGQMQRIAIARAIFSEHPILFFDEATSALDGPTEEKLLKNLRSMTDRTLLIVTHRPEALKVCDRVIEF